MRRLPAGSVGRAAVALALALGVSAVRSAQAQVSPGMQNAARCATTASALPPPADAPRVVAAQEPTPRRIFGSRDLLIVSAGTGQGAHVGQRFVVRRSAAVGDRRLAGQRAVTTAGWLRIIASNESTSIGEVEFSCEGVFVGDYLEPYVEVELPAGVERTEATGALDFSSPARVLFGNHERQIAAAGDFIVMDAGSREGVVSGARLAVYRNVHVPAVPLAWVGEAVAVRIDENTSVVRITYARDAVMAGDFLVPRRAPTGR